MNKDKITSVLSELHKISGFRVSLHDTDFEEIAAYPEEKNGFCGYIHNMSAEEYNTCKTCDKESCAAVLKSGETIIYKCRHGLIEAVSPIYNFGALTGFLMMGQVLPESDSGERILSVLDKLGTDKEKSEEILSSVAKVDEKMVRSYVNIMTICASYLTLSNSVAGSKMTVGTITKRYISDNYTSHIGVKDICKAVGYSKSTVLSSFKKEFSTTVNSYLNNLRLELAKKMLTESISTVNEIALSCGFSDQSYFSKVFSAKYGVTPTNYRKGVEG